MLALGGHRTGGNVKLAPTPGKLGWQVLDQWDLLWSPSNSAAKAAECGLVPGQLTSAIPGTRSITNKKQLTRTLSQVYGDSAYDEITPLTYELPAEIEQWLGVVRKQQMQHIKEQKALAAATTQQDDTTEHGQHQRQPRQHFWILKTAQHLGESW